MASASVNALPVSLVSMALGTSTVQPSNGLLPSFFFLAAQPQTVRAADNRASRTLRADLSSFFSPSEPHLRIPARSLPVLAIQHGEHGYPPVHCRIGWLPVLAVRLEQIPSAGRGRTLQAVVPSRLGELPSLGCRGRLPLRETPQWAPERLLRAPDQFTAVAGSQDHHPALDLGKPLGVKELGLVRVGAGRCPKDGFPPLTVQLCVGFSNVLGKGLPSLECPAPHPPQPCHGERN